MDHHPLLCPQLKNTVNTMANITRKVLTNGAERNGGKLPTLLFTTFVKSKGRKVRTIIDNGSPDHYVLNKMARRMKLRGVLIDLVSGSFGGHETKVASH